VFRIGLKCFFEEGRALARIVHPNVVRVLNFFRANETVYMVMAYESGHSLQEHIRASAPRAARRRSLHPQHLHGVCKRPARGPRQQAAAPGPETGQYLPAHRRHADAAGLRRRAPDHQHRHADAGADVHARLRAARAVHQGRTLGPWSDIYSIGASMFACMAGAPPQPADQRKTEDKMAARFAKLEGSIRRSWWRWCGLPGARSAGAAAKRVRVQKVLQVRGTPPRAAPPAPQAWRRPPAARPGRTPGRLRPSVQGRPGHAGIEDIKEPCNFPSTSKATSAAARSTRTAWATAYTRDALLLVLADGMGGHLRGEIAASIALQTMSACSSSRPRPM
jgi:serine/threonine protein kinase